MYITDLIVCGVDGDMFMMYDTRVDGCGQLAAAAAAQRHHLTFSHLRQSRHNGRTR